MSILTILSSIWRSMLQLFWFAPRSLTNTLRIYVKSNTGSTLPVSVNPKWEIKNVKEVIAPKLGLAPEEVKIILAGKELEDSLIIEECDLGEQSILHAVPSRRRNSSSASTPLSQVLSDLTLAEIPELEDTADELISSEKKAKAHFYVFCSSPCRDVKTGKLRVRCHTCKSGAITVDLDPASWDDVRKPQRISGHCEAENCPDGPVAWAEFYFKCAEHTSEGESDQAAPLDLIRSNTHSIPCLSCTDVCEPVLVFPCRERHVACLPCFTQYCIVRLRDRNFVSHTTYGYTLPCPAGCPESYITEPHHFRLLPPIYYSQYQRFGAEEFVLKSGGVLCPQPGCGAGILPDPDCSKVTCIKGCGYVFCRHCLQGYHIGACSSVEETSASMGSTYTIDPARAAQARWDEASKVAIKVTTKPCPKCRTPTERDGGCMHMVCTRCSFEWCWVCQVDWTRTCMGSHWFG